MDFYLKSIITGFMYMKCSLVYDEHNVQGMRSFCFEDDLDGCAYVWNERKE